jgi:hypothetical protein
VAAAPARSAALRRSEPDPLPAVSEIHSRLPGAGVRWWSGWRRGSRWIAQRRTPGHRRSRGPGVQARAGVGLRARQPSPSIRSVTAR